MLSISLLRVVITLCNDVRVSRLSTLVYTSCVLWIDSCFAIIDVGQDLPVIQVVSYSSRYTSINEKLTYVDGRVVTLLAGRTYVAERRSYGPHVRPFDYNLRQILLAVCGLATQSIDVGQYLEKLQVVS